MLKWCRSVCRVVREKRLTELRDHEENCPTVGSTRNSSYVTALFIMYDQPTEGAEKCIVEYSMDHCGVSKIASCQVCDASFP